MVGASTSRGCRHEVLERRAPVPHNRTSIFFPFLDCVCNAATTAFVAQCFLLMYSGGKRDTALIIIFVYISSQGMTAKLPLQCKGPPPDFLGNRGARRIEKNLGAFVFVFVFVFVCFALVMLNALILALAAA